MEKSQRAPAMHPEATNSPETSRAETAAPCARHAAAAPPHPRPPSLPSCAARRTPIASTGAQSTAPAAAAAAAASPPLPKPYPWLRLDISARSPAESIASVAAEPASSPTEDAALKDTADDVRRAGRCATPLAAAEGAAAEAEVAEKAQPSARALARECAMAAPPAAPAPAAAATAARSRAVSACSAEATTSNSSLGSTMTLGWCPCPWTYPCPERTDMSEVRELYPLDPSAPPLGYPSPSRPRVAISAPQARACRTALQLDRSRAADIRARAHTASTAWSRSAAGVAQGARRERQGLFSALPANDKQIGQHDRRQRLPPQSQTSGTHRQGR